MSRVPRIRFKGFEEDWEQRKFSDLAETHRGLTYKPSDIRNAGTRVLRSSNITEDQFTYGDDDIFVEPDAVNIPYANQGDILITSANGSTRLVGKHTIIRDIANNSAVHGGFMLLATAENSGFVNALMSAPWYTKFISLYVAGGNGAIGNLNKSDLDEQDVFVPGDTEQKVIGRYFSQLDHLITLHQRKLKKLKNIKKSMLENLFPKNGEKTPRIRFSGFTEDWEQRKLGELATYFEYGLNVAAKEYDGENKYIRITDIDDESHEFRQDNLTSPDTDLSVFDKYKLSDGDLLFSRTGASVGKSYIYKASDGLVYYAGFLIRARIKEENNSEFVYQNTLTSKYVNFIKVTSMRSGQPGVNAQEYSQFEIRVPSKVEQDTITYYFSNLDHLITLHQSKLEKLQKIKKSMLESMFV